VLLQAVSGDADLPVREDLGERRRNYEIQQAAKASVTNDTDDSDGKAEGNGQDEDKDPEEDDFYMQAKQLKEAKQAAKAAKYSRTLLSPVEELDADGKRQITYQMEKNRGLTPYRKKATKNPRKKYKLKHEKAVIRRKGQVREVRRPTSASYGGESTGIRTNLSRSVRFKN
jgi:U3 small nucleolar RNA-associated protein 3